MSAPWAGLERAPRTAVIWLESSSIPLNHFRGTIVSTSLSSMSRSDRPARAWLKQLHHDLFQLPRRGFKLGA